MNRSIRCGLPLALVTVGILSAASGAEAIWVRGAEKEMNAFYGFAAEFEAKAGDDPVLAFSAASVARVYVNGTLAAYGPARAPEGCCRIDRRPLGAFVRDGRNVIAIEVSNPAVNQFYLPEREAFLFAEVRDARGRVLAATGRDFKATDLPRVRRTSRFSYQRGFSEFYRGSGIDLLDEAAAHLDREGLSGSCSNA